tara:strand:+ start:888 stop:1070 length:183 start_codon:yes stop_codon:yes gene_type:complete
MINKNHNPGIAIARIVDRKNAIALVVDVVVVAAIVVEWLFFPYIPPVDRRVNFSDHKYAP